MTMNKAAQECLATQIEAGVAVPGVAYDDLETYGLYKHSDGSLTANILGLAVLGACQGNVEAALTVLNSHKQEEIGELLGVEDDVRGRFAATVTILYPDVEDVIRALRSGSFMIL